MANFACPSVSDASSLSKHHTPKLPLLQVCNCEKELRPRLPTTAAAHHGEQRLLQKPETPINQPG